MNEKAAKELVKTRKAVRQKYNALKSDIASKEIRMEKEFKPITQPLQELIKTIKTEPFIKQEPHTPQMVSTPIRTFQFPNARTSNIYNRYLPTEMPSFLENEDVFELEQSRSSSSDEPTIADIRENVLELTRLPAYQEYLDSYHPLIRKFVDGQIKDTEDKFDHKYGIIHDVNTEKYKIANSPVEFIGKDFTVEGVKYLGTPGLYELLFKKKPVGYSVGDLENYMDVLKRTNAYRRNFDPNSQIQGSTDAKYITLIKPYLSKKGLLKAASVSEFRPELPSTSRLLPPQRPRSTRTKSGKGAMLNLSKKKLDYVYYDNLNEIIDRLRLLTASQMAGHTGHNNEINSILEELREARIIL